MTKKNSLKKQKDQHALLLQRERELKEKAAKKLAGRKRSQQKKRKIPKNLVRGASKDPTIYTAAIEKMRAKTKKKKRAAPKAAMHMEIDGTRQRSAQTQHRAKEARRMLIERRRES